MKTIKAVESIEPEKENSNSSTVNKVNGLSQIIYFSFAFLFAAWVLYTYRNIVHMDMMTIVSTKVKHLFEGNLKVSDFIYQPLFPCLISIVFTFLNALVFHLNTVVETAVGTVFLIILGFKYLKEISSFLSTDRNKILFAALVGFIIFGLHKWEATFTSFFSFAVFFNLCIAFFNYFFLVKYIDRTYERKKYHFPVFVLLNLLFIVEESAYFYSYILSQLLILLLINWFQIFAINKRRWMRMLLLNVILLIIAFGVSAFLSGYPAFKQYASSVSVIGFLHAFVQDPLWMIKFYLVAQSGPFIGEAVNYINLRALFGLIVLLAYGLSVFFVIKKRDQRLMVPVALILYNIISYGFVTMSRYVFNELDYGASSRYTAFGMSGVIGLATILLFFALNERKKISVILRYFSASVLMIILVGYFYVDFRQYRITPSRIAAFDQIKQSLLSGENLSILQADETVSLNAIEVLKKYQLNVYHSEKDKIKNEIVSLDQDKKIVLIAGNASFDDLIKTGFYSFENGIAWTNGNASIKLNNLVKISDTIRVEMNTYMPPICKNLHPKLLLTDEGNKVYEPYSIEREEDKFIYQFYFEQEAIIQKVNITADTINAFPDERTLSFPFKSLQLKKGN